MQIPAAEPSTTQSTGHTNTGIGRLRTIRWSYTLSSWLGLVPFLLFCLLFELLPALVIIQSSFVNDAGAVTLINYQHIISQPSTLRAFQTSISISFVTALLGAFFGFF